MALLAYEFYRISARPLLGGAAGARARPPLPGALCPRADWQLQPEKITPLADRLRAASKFAVETLQAEIGGTPAVEPPHTNGADPQRTAEQNTLSELLRQADELATDTSAEGEEKYHAIIAQIPAAEAAANASMRTAK